MEKCLHFSLRRPVHLTENTSAPAETLLLGPRWPWESGIRSPHAHPSRLLSPSSGGGWRPECGPLTASPAHRASPSGHRPAPRPPPSPRELSPISRPQTSPSTRLCPPSPCLPRPGPRVSGPCRPLRVTAGSFSSRTSPQDGMAHVASHLLGVPVVFSTCTNHPHHTGPSKLCALRRQAPGHRLPRPPITYSTGGNCNPC